MTAVRCASLPDDEPIRFYRVLLSFVVPSRPQQGYFLLRVRIGRVRLMGSHEFDHARY